MRPPISYFGGKQKIASWIVQHLPAHTVYCEPFCGGAAVMFAKHWHEPTNKDHYREYINDLSDRLVNFYRVLRDPEQGPELVRRLQLTPFARAEYDLSKQLLGTDGIDGAWAYFVKANASFGNVLAGGWRFACKGMNDGATFAKKCSELGQFLDRMSGVNVENRPALDVIRQLDRPQTLFYCDPPYPGTTQPWSDKFTLEDLADLLSAALGGAGSFVISTYDEGEIDGFQRVARSTTAGSATGKHGAGKGKRTEALYIIDRSDTMPEDLARVAWRPKK